MPGVYTGYAVLDGDGRFMNKRLVHEHRQTHVHKYMDKLMQLIADGKFDPRMISSHRTADLGDGRDLYKTFRAKD